MSTQNTKIAKSKFGGIRFPSEQSDVGNGYASSGPVITRQMTPEEIAKYGPAIESKDKAPAYNWRNKKQRGAEDMSRDEALIKAADKINQAVKVDIEKPDLSKIAIEAAERFKEIVHGCSNDLTIKAYGRETTALDAADEFYTLQEEVEELTATRDVRLARMQILKDALEKVMVTI